jgi:hypothetical protein
MRVHAICTLVLLVVTTSSRSIADPVVGAYYYPWYGAHDANASVRGHTLPQQAPTLGSYNSFDPATISAHIDQSHRGNIDFWALSWWGPNDTTDRAIRQTILPHRRASELNYAIHYETPGRLGDFDAPDYRNLISDFRYLADNVFHDPNYLRIDGRPVVFMYLSRAYFNEQVSRNVVANLRSQIQTEYGFDPYLVGDDIITSNVNVARAQLWDAVTDYDVYGTALQSQGSTTAGLDRLANVYDAAIEALAGSGVGFIPAASPGFNDKGVRDGHASAPRYLLKDPTSQPGDLFQQMLEDVVVPRVDPNASNILMINSFNEWHEDTQIEASVVTGITREDDSGHRRYTEGYAYEGYGGRYLDILREATQMDDTTFPNPVDSASFAHAMYQSVLDRPADSVGLNAWVAALQNGTSPGDVAREFVHSRERMGDVVDQYYRSFFGRSADPKGHAYWSEKISGGMIGTDIAVAFLTSGEYVAAHPNDAMYIDGLYECILGRSADPAGLDYFVSELQGGRDRKDIIRAFLGSRERLSRAIDAMYRDFLQRGVDPTGLGDAITLIETGAADLNDVAYRILTSNEFMSLARRRLDSSEWVYWDSVRRSEMASVLTWTDATTSVPEPTTFTLALVSVVVLTTGRCRLGRHS